MKSRLENTILIAVLAQSLFGCSSSTVISTEPSDADLYINGMKVGKTPYTYADTKIIGSTTSLKFKKEGYKDFEVALKRNEEVNVGTVIGGIFFLAPFLWVMEYLPSHHYELEKVEKQEIR